MRTIQANVPGLGFSRITIENDSITALKNEGKEREGFPYCWPGFIDTQINGFAGVDFGASETDSEQLASMLAPLFSTGVTTFLPTLTTNTIDALTNRLCALEKARKEVPLFGRAAPGYHLEGPWLSVEASHGAHDPKLMRLPEWDDFKRLQDAAAGHIRLLTIAPELPGAIKLIERAKAAGVVIAIGHTDGTSKDIYEATEAGATLSTHLGNGCPQSLDRHKAPFWTQLVEDRLKAGLICDNFHLTREMVKTVVRVKGIEGCILVTDAIHAAMMQPGFYRIVNTAAELLPTGQVVTGDRRAMAGSALVMKRAVINFGLAAGCRLVDALRAATINPLKIISGSEIGMDGFAQGAPADLILFEPGRDELCIHETILAGETVWSNNS